MNEISTNRLTDNDFKHNFLITCEGLIQIMKISTYIYISCVLFICPVYAEIITDGSIGQEVKEVPKVDNNYSIDASIGATKGSNLFHSFDKFNIYTNETATFTGPENIQTIFTRVTGGQSWIDGCIRSEINNADLYLMNTNGFIFGKNASLDIKGSFHVTTADYIRQQNNAFFYSQPFENEILSTAEPESFGFLGNNHGSIVFNGSDNLEQPTTGLMVPDGKTISIIGSAIVTADDTCNLSLKANNGKIGIVSVLSSGEVFPEDAYDISSFEQIGPINLSANVSIDAKNCDVYIRGGQLIIDNGTIDAGSGSIDIQAFDISIMNQSVITGLNISIFASANPDAEFQSELGIIQMTEQSMIETVEGESAAILIQADTFLLDSGILKNESISHDGGQIDIQVNELTLINGGRIDAGNYGNHKGTDINIISDSIIFSGSGLDDLNERSGIYAKLESNSSGDGGNISIKASTVSLVDGGCLYLDNYGTGNAGNVIIEATESVVIQGSSKQYYQIPSSIYLRSRNSSDPNAGNSGSLFINSQQISLQNGAQIVGTTTGAGKGALIHLNSSKEAFFDNSFIYVASTGVGDSGSLKIDAPQILFENGAQIHAGLFGSAKGAVIDVNGDNITFKGSGANDLDDRTGIYSNLETDSTGSGGTISIHGNTISFLYGGCIYADNYGEGQGTNVTLNANDQVSFEGESDKDTNKDNNIPSSVYLRAKNNGNTGNLSITGKTILFKDGAQISATSTGNGNGGKISLIASEQIKFTGEGSFINGSVIYVAASGYGKGNAAELELNAPEIIFEQGALISGTTWNKGRGSNININSSGSVIFRGESLGKCPEGDCRTQINISADDDNMQETGNAGILNIHANEILFENGAFIAGNTHTQGNGPILSLIADTSLIFEGESRAHKNSSIIMNTYGEGNAGEMDIRGRNIYLYDGALLVSNTGGKGNAGNISLFADEVIELSGEAEEYIVDGDGNYLGQSYFSSAVYASVWTTGQGGDGGNITVETNDLILKDGAYITTATFGNGNAGNLSIHAKGKISVEGANSKTGWASWISSASNPKVPGKPGKNGGQLFIKANELLLLDGGNISSSTIALKEGTKSLDASELRIDVSGSITLFGVNPYGETEDGFGSGIYANSKGIEDSAGKAGNIVINAKEISIKKGGVISTSTTGFSKGGDIDITADSIDISGDSSSIHLKEKQDAQHLFDKSFETNTVSFSTSGIYANSTDKTQNAGNAGAIHINAHKNLSMKEHGRISTEAINAGGGSVTILSDNLFMNHAHITTSVTSGNENGGDISLILSKGILYKSSILAQANVGDGGNIDIKAPTYFIQSAESIIDASSDLGIDGNIFIDAPDKQLTKFIALPTVLPDASQWLYTICDKRPGDQYNQFLLMPKDAIPTSPKDWLASPPISFEINDNDVLIRGEAYFRKGLFSKAIDIWENQTDVDILSLQWLKTLIYLSHAYLEIGYHQKAISIFEQYLSDINQSERPYQQSLFYNTLGDLYLSIRNMKRAKQYTFDAIKIAQKSKNYFAIARVLNHMGNYHAAKQEFQKAEECYSKALEVLANSYNQSEHIAALQSKLFINKAHALLEWYDKDNYQQELTNTLNSEFTLLNNFKNTYNTVFDMIALSIHIQKISEKFGLKSYILTCNDLLTLAIQMAEDLQHDRLLSFSYGCMGLLKQHEGEFDDAKQHFRMAVSYSQYHHPDIYYLWQWQIARILYQQNNIEQAALAYSLAVDTLNPCFQTKDSSTQFSGIIHQLFKGYRSNIDLFNQYVKPLYMEFVELLTKDISDDVTEHRAKKIRNIWESLKEIEIQNFFKDECVTTIKNKMKRLDQLPDGTALIYLILLKKRAFILLSISENTFLFKINEVSSSEIIFSANRLRKNLEKSRHEDSYKRAAKELYDYLIQPLKNHLDEAQVKHLIIAADGVLQLIPFSALLYENQFLSQQYGVSIVPTITLAHTEKVSYTSSESKAVLFGMSKGLPKVKEELNGIHTFFESEILLNEAFSYTNILSAINISKNSIIHIATHGSFGNNPDNRYLQLYRSKLTLNSLEDVIRQRFFQDPIDLLTLSACQTALGDDQTALGFAGISIKAGARSVIATLWSIPDSDSTCILMKQFYSNLSQGFSKTRALQEAKRYLIDNTAYKHPKYWSQFILIGNWL
ncbi:protein containing Filamentous hemagglutinin [Candidatus Magnetomorum sp. HK-1]|nr:protein containing Filamentous hemagglutinin [Candidatus Magnetomorum sp. HK-1]